MRALLKYFVLTAALVGLAWASVTIQIDGRSAASHVRERGLAWWDALRAGAEEAPKKTKARTKKVRPRTATARKRVPAKPAPRPVREIPPSELQSEPEADKRVELLATAAKRARAKVEAEEAKARATRITPDQKKALDDLLTNRQAP